MLGDRRRAPRPHHRGMLRGNANAGQPRGPIRLVGKASARRLVDVDCRGVFGRGRTRRARDVSRRACHDRGVFLGRVRTKPSRAVRWRQSRWASRCTRAGNAHTPDSARCCSVVSGVWLVGDAVVVVIPAGPQRWSSSRAGSRFLRWRVSDTHVFDRSAGRTVPTARWRSPARRSWPFCTCRPRCWCGDPRRRRRSTPAVAGCPHNVFMITSHEPSWIGGFVSPLRDLLVALVVLLVAVRLRREESWLQHGYLVRKRTLVWVLAAWIAWLTLMALGLVARRVAPHSVTARAGDVVVRSRGADGRSSRFWSGSRDGACSSTARPNAQAPSCDGSRGRSTCATCSPRPSRTRT